MYGIICNNYNTITKGGLSMKKFKIISLMLVLILGTVLSGCTKKAPTGGDKTTSKSENESSEGDSKKPVKLTFYGFSDWVDMDPYKATYEQVKADFEKENPGYIVELQSDPWGDWEQKYKTMLASGNAADIFVTMNDDLATFANGGNLLDLGKYTEAGYFDQFFPGVLNMYVWNGSNMGIPWTTDCRILWWNKDIFKEAGLDPEKPPKTWDELVAYANQITEKTGKYGFGMDMGLKQIPTASLLCASGSQIINVDGNGAITPNVDTPEFRKYLETLINLKGTFEPDYTTLAHHDVAKQFAAGQFGMIIGNNLTETDVYETDWYGQSLVPTMTEDTPKGTYGGGFAICISEKTKEPEMAVKFAQMLCDPKYNAGLISDIPATQEGMENSEFAKDSKFDIILEQVKYAGQTQPKTLYYPQIEAAAYDAVVEAVVGGKSIDETITNLSAMIEAIVKE